MLYPLGKLTSTTPGSPVTLASVLPSFLQGVVITSAEFVALGTNSGNVYFGNSTLNKTSGVGCYVGTGLVASQTFGMRDDNAAINRGTANLANGGGSGAPMNTNNIYFDVDDSGEGFGGYVTY